MLTLDNYRNGNLTRRFVVRDLNEERVLKYAKNKYRDAVRAGYLKSRYESDVWILHAQGRGNTAVRFSHEAQKVKEKLPPGQYEAFIMHLKTLVLLRLGTCRQQALGAMVHYILEEMALSGFKPGISPPRALVHGTTLNYLIEMIKVTDWAEEGYLDECYTVQVALYKLECDDRKTRKHPCILNEFASYFRFDHIIRKAWKEDMDEIQRRFYFPLVFFWMLTTILPLRVMEYCVLPYDCIETREGKYYISVRRSRLKGSTSRDIRIHYYRIDKDYYLDEYEIPKWMYDMVEAWRQETKDFYHAYDLLFSLEYTASLGCLKMFVRSEESVFDTGRLNQMLKMFYKDFVLKRYGMTLVTADDLMERYKDPEDGSYKMYRDEIMMLQLKHTRHLAMINLIRWGCNPMIIKNFAGHTSAEMDENYYSNTSRFVRCATKILWERTADVKNPFIEQEIASESSNMSIFFHESDKRVRVDGGFCYSADFMEGNYEWCYKCNGDCDKCRYFEADNPEAITPELEQRINADVKGVMAMLKSDKVEAMIEDAHQKILKLEADLQNFSTRVWKEFMERQSQKEYEYECG